MNACVLGAILRSSFCVFLSSMIPETFETLLGVVGPLYKDKIQRGDGQLVDARKALLMSVFYLAQRESYFAIADRFDVAESTCIYEVEYILTILIGLKSKYIVWPRKEDCPAITHQFQERAGHPPQYKLAPYSH